MSFRDKDVAISYRSLGETTISDIISPLLNETKTYKRSVGFFNSSAFNFISEGIKKLAMSRLGKIQLITSPKLTQEDYDAILLGHKLRQEAIMDKFFEEIVDSSSTLTDENLRLLVSLIEENIMDIKIVTKKNGGMYHDKLAILHDYDGNIIAFTGSNNETSGGYSGNYEKVRVFKSWIDQERVLDEEKEFDDIWNGKNPYLETHIIPEVVKNSIIQIIKNRAENKEIKEPYDLYDYQNEAISSWAKNGYNGFFVMATGTGKTVTSIYAIKELVKHKDVFVVIAVPYKHLVTQWYEDVNKILPEAEIFKVTGEINGWENPIINSILQKKYGNTNLTIVISTISSFYSSRFSTVLELNKLERLLVIDEAHNFYNKIKQRKFFIEFEYRLGLSATPYLGSDISKTKELLSFFGGMVFELPIEQAIGKFLVNYYYTPIFVKSTKQEEIQFAYQTRQMASCFDSNGTLIEGDKFIKAHRNRLRIISMASEKINGLQNYIKTIENPSHFIIYCSDGKTNDEKHLQTVVNLLDEMGYRPSRFTATESMAERENLINNFNKGYISTLVAIRCLDEGINIPSIETALILSSNDNYREFVQRRGRILRKYKNKKHANIIDIIVLPSEDMSDFAKIELRRFHEYSKLALNKDILDSIIINKMDLYGLKYSDIEFNHDISYTEEELDD